MSYHAVVWMDHTEAKIFELMEGTFELRDIKAHKHMHHRGPAPHEPGHRVELSADFCKQLAAALAGPRELLLLGPSGAKNEFLQYLKTHAPMVAAKVLAAETVDHPTDAQVVAYARRYFKVADVVHG